jgi:hypothetical protein
MNAESETSAEEWFLGKEFKDGLIDDGDGQPLWNGAAQIFVREAIPEEFARWQAGHDLALSHREINDDEPWIAFLVPVAEG